MTPEQRAQVNELFAAALDCISGERSPVDFGDKDPEVRKEVERLLRLHFESGSFLKTSAEAAPQLVFAPGQMVAGRYRILEHAGHGMGEVYRAEGTALGKIIALKVILPRLVSDEAALRQFRREIAAAQQVTHPNVCRVFDLQRHEDSSGG